MPKDQIQISRLGVSIGQASQAGRKTVNQDFHGAMIPDGPELDLKGICLAVADGISSSSISGEAAETAVKSLLTDYYCTSDAWTVKTAACEVIRATNSWLYAQNRMNRISDMNSGLVCTLSALILKERRAHLFHIGDSRIYRVSGGSLEQLTEDHRRVLSSAENYLARALGAEPVIEIEYRALPLNAGDVFLLTTDGVHDHIDGPLVRDTLLTSPDLSTAATRLVEAALQRGSMDNLTLQILRVDHLPSLSDRLPSLDETAPLPVPPLPRPGDQIDGFRIDRALQATSRSHVYLATDPNGQRVALKIPATEMRDDPSYLRRFLLEEWIARRLTSAHVLPAAQAPQQRSALYSVTEFIEGQTLRQWMTDTPRPELEQMRDIIEQISRGLRAFHRREMLHQDLRPENIMIDRAGTVKIIDFGSTSVAGVEEAAPGVAGALPGTYQYTAPEYLSGGDIGRAADQFALGVIAYEMLTGRLPYGTQVAKIRSRRDQMRLRYRSALAEDTAVPDWIDDALRRAVHPDPHRRYPALSELVAALKAPDPNRARRRYRPLIERDPLMFWKGLSALLALLLIVLLSTFFT